MAGEIEGLDTVHINRAKIILIWIENSFAGKISQMSAVVLRMISRMPALLAAVNRQDRDAERGPVQILAGPAAVPAEAVKMDQAWIFGCGSGCGMISQP